MEPLSRETILFLRECNADHLLSDELWQQGVSSCHHHNLEPPERLNPTKEHVESESARAESGTGQSQPPLEAAVSQAGQELVLPTVSTLREVGGTEPQPMQTGVAEIVAPEV